MNYAHCDTTKPDGFYVQFERVLYDDNDTQAADFDCYDENDLEEFKVGSRCFVGVCAVAKCLIVHSGTGTFVNIESPGLWGVDGDESYYNDVYQDQINELKTIIASLHDPVYE